MRQIALMLAFCLILPACTPSNVEQDAGNSTGIQVVDRSDKKRVDVFIDGTLFTSYLYSDETSRLKKPVLYPLRTASGIDITRGYPLEKRAGERVDHPHHIGHWLNYGDVNGLDFWNHSEQTSAERKEHAGTILHRAVTLTQSGESSGELSVEADWIAPDGALVLTEQTTFVFYSGDDQRVIDRTTTLTAANGDVSFSDNKEGMIAIRVTRALEHAEGQPVLLTMEGGAPAEERVINDEGVTGNYLSSADIEGTDVWGTRAEWVVLRGTIQDEPVAVAIIDHPENPGYPTYWHARGYGLFSANPLGQAVFSEGAEVLDFKLADGESTTFKYRMAILSNEEDPGAATATLFDEFSSLP